MSDDKTYSGSCFCGAVELTVSGEALVMGYCHCDSCRHWSGAPVSTYTLWSPESVQITKGEENVLTYNKTEKSYRKTCKICGGPVFIDYKPENMIDINAAIIPGLEFKPKAHVHYQESVLSIKDGLPKFKDLPEEAGGSGELLPE